RGFLEGLALAIDPGAVGDARALAKGPTIAHRGVEKAVARGGDRAPAVATVHGAAGVEVVLALEPGASAAAAGARLRAQAGTVAEQVARAQGKQVVVAVAAAVVVQGQLAGRAEFERAAHTLGVTQRRQHRLGRAGGALLVQPGQLDRERRGVVRPPLAVELALLKRLPALLGAGVAAVQAQRVVNPAQELGAVFLAR